MSILDLLRADGSIVVNKKLAHEIGLNETIILSELISLYTYFGDRGELDDSGYFYATMEKIEENTTFKRTIQDKAINNLCGLGLVSKVTKGLPAKRYFTIHEDKIQELILGLRASKAEKPHGCQVVVKQQTRTLDNNEQDGLKPASNNTYNNPYNNTDLNECMTGDSSESVKRASKKKTPKNQKQNQEPIEVSEELSFSIYEALENGALNKCYKADLLPMDRKDIGTIYTTILKKFSTLLHPEIVEVTCEQYKKQTDPDIMGKLKFTPDNPIGFFIDLYDDAFKVWKAERHSRNK